MELKIGQKIKELRLASDLTQEELANRAQISKGFISQLENEQSSVQVDTLADILEVLGVSMTEFFDDAEDDRIVFSPDDRIQVDSTGAARYQLLVPGSTNNMMDPALIELKPGEELEVKDPHPGEQFGFVLQGTASVRLGKKVHKAASKHSVYFVSDRPHQISNQSNTIVKLLWVTTPPQM